MLADRPVLIEHPLIAEDTRAFLGALRQLGLAVSGTDRALSIGVGPRVKESDISCAASGTMLRFLIASLSTLPGVWTLDGSPRLRQRPAAALIKVLRRLGARIECLGEEGYAPLRINGGELGGGRVEIDAGASSQYVSALMMAALRATETVVIEARSLVSAPYVEMTHQAIRDWGGAVEVEPGGRIVVMPSALEGGRLAVEGDFSSACYLAAGAAVLGGAVAISGLNEASAQGDRRFFDLLGQMGVTVDWRRGEVKVSGAGSLTAIECDMSDMPDQVPTLAVLAPFARGTTRITNVPHLRIKESDRLASVAAGLQSVGAMVEEQKDGLTIPGVWAESPAPSNAVCVAAANDHRIAMSFAVLGLARRGVEIDQPKVVDKSYPGFWTDFERCFEA